MLQNSWVILCALAIIGLLVRTAHAQTPKKEEKIRAYEFGFTVDEQQHRHERRDERGIVMGEFGFITADGIYHVTVYATDEEGKFRILAMRNYPYESPPKTVDMIVKSKPKPDAPITRTPPTSISTTTLRAIIEQKVLPKFNFNTEGCAGCFIKNGPPKDAPKLPEEGNLLGTPIRPLSQPLPLRPVQSQNTIKNSPGGGKVEISNFKVPQVYLGAIVTTANQEAVEKSILNLAAKKADELPLIFETTINTLDIDSETPIHITPIVPFYTNVAASTISEVQNPANGDEKTPISYSSFLTATENTNILPTNFAASTISAVKSPANGDDKTPISYTPFLTATEDTNILPNTNTFTTLEKIPTKSETLTPTLTRYTNTPKSSAIIPNTQTITNAPVIRLNEEISPTFAQSKVPTATSLATRTQTKTPTPIFAERQNFKSSTIPTLKTQSNRPTFADKQTSPAVVTNLPITFDGDPKATPTFSIARQQPKSPTITIATKTPIRYTNTPKQGATKDGQFPNQYNAAATEKSIGSTFPLTATQSNRLPAAIPRTPGKPFVFNDAKSTVKASNFNNLDAKIEEANQKLSGASSGLLAAKSSVLSSRINAGVPTVYSKTPATDRTVSYTTPLLNKAPTTNSNLRFTPTQIKTTPTLTQTFKSGKPDSQVRTQSQKTPTIVQNQIPPTTTLAGLSPQSNAKNPSTYSAPSVGNTAKPQFTGSATARPGSGLGSSTGKVSGFGGTGKMLAIDPRGSFDERGGITGRKTISGEPGDLYRFKYILDYNGHTETGSRNGNKKGNYYAIGDDNVERTIEYVANELGYQPRIRWRKLDAPVASKENTLKDYEFVWFKEQ